MSHIDRIIDRFRRWARRRAYEKAEAARTVSLRELTAAQPARLREIEWRQAADADAKILRVSGKVDELGRPVTTPRRWQCPTCRSLGFQPSVLGPTRCTFCDGTEAGLDPWTSEVPR